MDRGLKILMVSWHYDGGIVHYTHNLCMALDKLGVEVVYLTSKRNKEIDKFEKNYRVKKVIWLTSKKGSLWGKLSFVPLKLLSYSYNFLVITAISTKFKVVHFQWYIIPRFDYFTFLFLKVLGKKLVYTVHNLLPHEEHRNDRPVLQRLYNLPDAVVVHGEFTRSEMISDFGINRNKIHKISMGSFGFFRKFAKTTDCKKFKKELGIPNDWGVFLFFGGIRDYKGLDTLILAFDKIHKKIKAKLLVVGGTWDFTPYQKLLNSINSRENIITRIGYVPIKETYKYFLVSDIMVAPYKKTTMSGSVLAAYGLAKPVITTKTGDIPEFVEEGKTGWLVDPEDIEGLATKMTMAIRDKNKLEKMGNYAFELSEKKYSWKLSAEKTKKIYEDLYLHPNS